MTWKAFVEDEYLVPLGEALFYLGGSKLNNYDVCLEHRFKLAPKLQLQQVDTSTLLLRVDALWRNRDSKILERFVNIKCRQKWCQFSGKALVDEPAVTEFQMICKRIHMSSYYFEIRFLERFQTVNLREMSLNNSRWLPTFCLGTCTYICTQADHILPNFSSMLIPVTRVLSPKK